MAKAPELFANANELRIERMEILASK
jgi:hypothetical protein